MTEDLEDCMRHSLRAWAHACGVNLPVDEISRDLAQAVKTRLMVDHTQREPANLPRKLTAENGAKAALIGEFHEDFGYLDDGGNERYIKVAVTWDTIKRIWDKAVEHFDAHPVAPAEGEPAAVRQALVAINAAHESMFVQCCSNPIKNAWGKDVDVSLLNEAHRLADIALASLRSAAVSDNRHPWYGPCDALGPQGQCAECMKLGRRSPAATAMLIPMRGPDCACCESQPRKDCTVPGCTMKDADYALAASCSQPENAGVEAHIDRIAADNPDVPRGVIRSIIAEEPRG